MEQVDRMWDEYLRVQNKKPYTISPAAREKAMAIRRDHERRREIQYIDGLFLKSLLFKFNFISNF